MSRADGCGYLRAANAPLMEQHKLADARHWSGQPYVGETAGPRAGVGRTYDDDGRPFAQGRLVDGVCCSSTTVALSALRRRRRNGLPARNCILKGFPEDPSCIIRLRDCRCARSSRRLFLAGLQD